MAGKFLGLEDGEAEQCKTVSGVPAILGSFDPDEEQSIGNFGAWPTRSAVVQTLEVAFHAAPSFWPG